MPVIDPSQPTVNVSVPVPTPVAPKPKPKTPTPAPEALPAAIQPPAQPLPLSGVILPWAGGELPNRMSRLPKRVIRFSSHELEAFLKAVRATKDHTPRMALSDYLEENPELSTPTVIARMRTHPGHLWIGMSPGGKVNAIPTASKEHFMSSRGHIDLYADPAVYGLDSRKQPRSVRISGRLKTWKTRPDEFRIPAKYGMYENLEIVPRNAHEFLTENPLDEPS